ncbi:MAG: glycosyltransferase family 39 protein [Candidatus Acidiferrales bacterium]
MAKLSQYERILVLIFVLTLPLINPWVRGDGVGYYAMGRALLIQHDLNFKQDWLMANPSFRLGRTDPDGNILPLQYTVTGHLDNHFSIGPAILWSPFLIAAHLGVLSYDALGGRVSADGFSKPYVIAMALGTALYGFLALWFSFRLARKHLPEQWAFLATLGIWFASSLPVYMYFNPSWSHAHSAFMVALFLWYWDHTRGDRSWAQWAGLGALGGLMMDIYYPNAILLLFPLFESLPIYWKSLSGHDAKTFGGLFLKNVSFTGVVLAAFTPTLITKKLIYGSYLNFGYKEHWFWNSPALLKVSFSAEHGLFSWTPIVVLAFIGLFFLWKYDRTLSLNSVVGFAIYVYFIGCFESWNGGSSFGSRYCIPLTALFVLGLSAFFDRLSYATAPNQRRGTLLARTATAAFVLWNLGLIFQWGTHLLPARGPISWREAAYNQVAVVPGQAAGTLMRYLTHRKRLMRNLEEEDLRQLKSRQADNSE